MKKIVILGIFFSGYNDVWVDFINLFKMYWKDCPYDFYIVADTNSCGNFMGMNVIDAGQNAEYSKKIQTAMQLINADYYLILLEDFFFSKKINNEHINSIVDYIENNNLSYYVMPMKEFKGNYKGRRISKYLRKISPNAEYTLSCQPAFWKRDFIEKCLGKANYNAWVFEGIYCKSKYAHTKVFLDKCIADISNPLGILHGIQQGKLIPETIRKLKSFNYTLTNERPSFTKKALLKVFFHIGPKRLLERFFLIIPL